MQKITPCIWFDNQAEEAAIFYTSVFGDAKIIEISYYQEGGPGSVGQVMLVRFQLEGQEFSALNGGPMFQLTPAISMFVNCADQEEVDRLWAKLTEGGSEMPCGWATDKYGVTWQIVPNALIELMHGKDPEKSKRVFQAMMDMKKIDIATLKNAYDNK